MENTAAVRLCGVLQWYWDRHGHVHEGRLWLQMALACGGDAPAVMAASVPRYVLQSRAQLHYEQALLGRRAHRDKIGMADLLPGLAAVAFRQGDYAYAVACCKELLLLAKELGDRARAAQAALQLGRLLIHRGEVDRAIRYLDQSCALAPELDVPPLLARVLACQGDVALGQGDYARARRRYGQSLQIAHKMHDTLELAAGLASLADVASAQADAEGAATLLTAAGGLTAQAGAPLLAAERPHWQRIMAAARAQLGAAAYARACAVGSALSAAAAVAYALTWLG